MCAHPSAEGWQTLVPVHLLHLHCHLIRVFTGTDPRWCELVGKPEQQDRQRLGNLPSTSHSISCLENAGGKNVKDMPEAEQESSGKAQPIPLSPVL